MSTARIAVSITALNCLLLLTALAQGRGVASQPRRRCFEAAPSSW